MSAAALAQPAISAAHAVALRAKIGDLDQMAIDDMVARAGELLKTDDPLFRAITGFATQAQTCRHDEEALAMQGRILEEAVMAALGIGNANRAPRRDIDG